MTDPVNPLLEPVCATDNQIDPQETLNLFPTPASFLLAST